MYSVTLTLDTNAYADGDLLADTQLVGAVGRIGKRPYIDSVQVIDFDDVKGALDLVFLNASTTMGTENSAPNMTDANILANALGHLSVAAADYKDFGGASQAFLKDLNIPVPLGPTGSLYVAAISRDAKTYSVNGLRLKIGVVYK